jgi:hypothetical protein
MLASLILLLAQEVPVPPPVPTAEPAAAAAPARLAAVERVLLTVPEDYAAATLIPAFAPDGARVAVAVYDVGERSLLLVDGVPTEPRHWVRPPRFSADGKHLALVWGERVKADREEWELILDGKRVRQADWIGDPTFAPVGDDYAVWIGDDVRVDADGQHTGGEYTCNWGRKKAAGYSYPPWQDPQWSADGRHLGFIGQKPSRSMAVCDGKEFGPFDWAAGFTWSPDGKTAAWTGMKDWGDSLIYVGKKSFGEEYENVGAPALGADGAMAYLATVRGRAALIFNENIVPGFYDDMGTPAISPDGKRVAVAANLGRKEESFGWYVDNNWMDGALDEDAKEIEKATFEAGSKCFLLIDGHRVGSDWWRVVRPFFSPDSRHVAARARSEEGWQVLLDGGASPAYEEVFAPRFSADGARLEFGARRGRDLLWVALTVE